MTTPAGLIELMTHLVIVSRHGGMDVDGDQIIAEVVRFPCYVTHTKPDAASPSWDVYVGITDNDEELVQQGDYIELGGQSGDAELYNVFWSIAAVQTWWDDAGGIWCQQLNVDCHAVKVELLSANQTPDDEGKQTPATSSGNIWCGIRPMTSNEMNRGGQVGQQTSVFMRFPSAIDYFIQRDLRINVTEGPQAGLYDVVTVDRHEQAGTAQLRRYEP